MNNLRQVALGILAALLSTAIILGSLSLTLSEGKRRVGMVSVITETPVLLPGQPTSTPAQAPSISPSATQSCPVPSGWVIIQTKPGDTFESLAEAYQTTAKELADKNCLPAVTSDLPAGMRFAVPAMPATPTVTHTGTATETPERSATPTEPAISCGRPSGWITYTVRRGDTLYSIAQLYDTTVYALQVANCMIGSDDIMAGQQLYVPNVPTRTFTSTYTPRPSRTPTPVPGTTEPTPTETESPPTPSDTPMPSETPITPPPPIETPTETSAPTPTDIPTPTLPPIATVAGTSTQNPNDRATAEPIP